MPLLSTPHGALGTALKLQTRSFGRESFNSTRCIRNLDDYTGYIYIEDLSTPHGALGTEIWNNHIVHVINLSTPHGALGTPNCHIN